MTESQKCQRCNNQTLNPSGLCYLHDGALTGPHSEIAAIALPEPTSLTDGWYSEWEDDWSEETAALWADAGFTPDQAAEWYDWDSGYYKRAQYPDLVMPMEELVEWAQAQRADTGASIPGAASLWATRIGPVFEAMYESEVSVDNDGIDNARLNLLRLSPDIDLDTYNAEWRERFPSVADQYQAAADIHRWVNTRSSFVGDRDSVGKVPSRDELEDIRACNAVGISRGDLHRLMGEPDGKIAAIRRMSEIGVSTADITPFVLASHSRQNLSVDTVERVGRMKEGFDDMGEAARIAYMADDDQLDMLMTVASSELANGHDPERVKNATRYAAIHMNYISKRETPYTTTAQSHDQALLNRLFQQGMNEESKMPGYPVEAIQDYLPEAQAEVAARARRVEEGIRRAAAD